MRIRKISQIVFVLKKKTPHEYDSGTSKYPSKCKQIGSEKRFFLTRIILTEDDILRYSDEEEDTSFIKFKKPIIIDIYI